MITHHNDLNVFVGIDIGKTAHHAVALTKDGTQLLPKTRPQNEAKLRALVNRLRQHGRLLIVVDQPATIGALPVAVGHSCQ